MNFVIEQLVPSQYTNCFVLETEWMHGDADQYTTETHIFTQEEADNLESEIKNLNIIGKMFRHGMSGSSKYGEEAERLGIELSEDFVDNIPYDLVSYYGHAEFQQFKLFWYDESGNKFTVKIEE